MSILDAFFSVAVPLVVLTLIVGAVVQHYDKARGIYRGKDGSDRRSEINKRWGTNKGAVVIGVIFLGVWGLIVAALIEQWGAVFFTFVVAALMLIPVATVAVCVIALYTLLVHAIANARQR